MLYTIVADVENTGVIIVQHGDLPFDFKDREPKLYEMAERMMERLSDETRALDRSRWQDPHKEDTEKLAEYIKKYVNCELEVGYLDFCRPTIGEAVQRLKSRGIKKIVFVNSPGLMMRSSHSLVDVPEALKKIAGDGDIEMTYARPGIARGVIEAIVIKISRGLRVPYQGGNGLKPLDLAGYGIVLVAHGDVPPDYIKAKRANTVKSEHYVEKMSELARGISRNDINDPLYHDSIEVADRRKGGFARLEVANLEFSRPSVGEVVDSMAAEGIKSILFVGGTGFFDRSSHSLIDIPAAIERQRQRYPGILMTYALPDVDLVMPQLARAVIEKLEEALKSGTPIQS
jgi:sirohydrochlorin cobaltochelatase